MIVTILISMRITIARILIASVGLLVLCQLVVAGEEGSSAKLPITIGIGVGYIDQPYEDFDSDEKTSLTPIILYEGKHFFARGQTIGWDFTTSDEWELAVIAEYLNYGYEDSDSDFLSGMRDRDPSIGVGGHVVWKPNEIGMKLAAVTDVAGKSEGSQVRAELFYVSKFGDGFTVTPSFSIIFQDADFNDYYYGVRSSEATMLRPAYEAENVAFDDDLNYRFRVDASYQRPGSQWRYMGGITYELLGDEIDDSPIVEDDLVLSAFIGIGFTFGN